MGGLAANVAGRRWTDAIIVSLTLLLGIFMLIYGVAGEIRGIDENPDPAHLASFVPMVVCGSLVVLDRHRSIQFATGMYAIGLGLSRILENLLKTFFISSNLGFLICLATTIIGVNMVYSGSEYLKGNTRTIALIVLGTVMLILMSLASLFVDFDGTKDLYAIIRAGVSDLSIIGLCLMYLSLVCTKIVHDGTSISQFNLALSGYRVAQGTVSSASVSPESCSDIVRFCSGGSEFVKKGSDGGPVHAEYEFVCREGPFDIFGVLQRWHGPEGEIYLSLSPFKGGSSFGVKSFRVMSAEVRDGRLVIDCDDRLRKVFRIREADEDDGPVSSRKDFKRGASP